MFAQNGFDGFLPKPINVRQLNAVLNRFIRDKYR
jgi:DNA-binding response OmpR family regulator